MDYVKTAHLHGVRLVPHRARHPGARNLGRADLPARAGRAGSRLSRPHINKQLAAPVGAASLFSQSGAALWRGSGTRGARLPAQPLFQAAGCQRNQRGGADRFGKPPAERRVETNGQRAVKPGGQHHRHLAVRPPSQPRQARLRFQQAGSRGNTAAAAQRLRQRRSGFGPQSSWSARGGSAPLRRPPPLTTRAVESEVSGSKHRGRYSSALDTLPLSSSRASPTRSRP